MEKKRKIRLGVAPPFKSPETSHPFFLEIGQKSIIVR
jgi:hypothetical protein